MSAYLIHAVQVTLGAVMLWCELSTVRGVIRGLLPDIRLRRQAR